MGFLFTPKHQKLVNQCYPPGRTPDKKPKSSETSYLLYYVNSRRPKLEKVSTYLVKKSSADLNRRRSGNVSVTLELLEKIVQNCSENMNIFIKDFINIMTLVLNNNNFNNDPTIVGQVEQVFAAISKNLDGSIVSGDSEFLDMFKSFVTLYFKVATSRLNDSDLLLKGCLDFSTISNLGSIHQWSSTAKYCVSTALTKFQEKHPIYGGATIGAAPSDSSPNNVTKRLTRTQTKVIGLDDVAESSDYSILTLNSFFNTTETDKLTLSIHALLDHLLKTPNKELLQFICNGIPVQLRYVVILLFIRPLGTAEKSKSLTLLKLISSLLTSGVSIIGLSVIDILRKLINVQLANSDSSSFVNQIATTIKDLNRKTYYKQQLFDMFTELSFKFIENGKPHHTNLLLLDLDALISVANTECLDLDLFADFIPYVSDREALLKLLYKDAPHYVIFIRFFDKLKDLTAEQIEFAFSTAFYKYKGSALLSGLTYYLNATQPSVSYYLYHFAAAKFLEIPDYQSQVQFKKSSKELFSREDLLNYYSDAGSNNYSEKGRDILLVENSDETAVDLTNEDTHDSTPIPISQSSVPFIPLNSSIMKRHPTSDSHSIKSLKHNSAPKVKDLKNLVSFKKDKQKVKTLRGSQSVKSKVTNITFLLSELDNDASDIKIRDPDDEEIVGMEKQDLARSYSLRLSTVGSSVSKTLVPPVELAEDRYHDEEIFRDAQEDLEISSSTRGRLFMA